MRFERDHMPLVALQRLRVGYGPALIVLVDKRLSIVADLAGEVDRFGGHLLGFRGFLLHLAGFGGLLGKRE